MQIHHFFLHISQGDVHGFISHSGESIDDSLQLWNWLQWVLTNGHWVWTRRFVCPDAWCLLASSACGLPHSAVQRLVVCVRIGGPMLWKYISNRSNNIFVFQLQKKLCKRQNFKMFYIFPDEMIFEKICSIPSAKSSLISLDYENIPICSSPSPSLQLHCLLLLWCVTSHASHVRFQMSRVTYHKDELQELYAGHRDRPHRSVFS